MPSFKWCDLIIWLVIVDPACQYINTKHHCYVMDPSCPADVHTEENNNHQTLIFAYSVIGGLLVVLIIAAGFFFWRQRTQQGNENPGKLYIYIYIIKIIYQNIFDFNFKLSTYHSNKRHRHCPLCFLFSPFSVQPPL